MKEVLNVYKLVGETPLEVIEKFKKKNPEYSSTPITYAGRLDPLAEGVLILLAGSKVNQKDEYLEMDKEYQGEVLLGFQSDTFDILGLPSFSNRKGEKVEKGEFEFSLPPFSSYKIKGRPLFWWARNNKLEEIKIPIRKTQIYDIQTIDEYEFQSKDLLDLILKKINLVKGDFRQDEIKEKWKDLLEKENIFKILKIRVSCSKGTYIRSIADKLGGVLLSLKRNKVGDFSFEKSQLI